jgi:uncharacterized protein (TIGR02646 family)|tara:strand:- start:787 stop:1290 length:504 start_codon:yes stop_codon:yes gene_type:complete
MIKIDRPDCPNQKALDSQNYKHPTNKEALRKANFDKCMYCESKISHVDFGDIEHIKPKSKLPELQYNWDNLGYSCSICNNNKKDKYDETCSAINPYHEDPSHHVIFSGAMLFSKQGSEKGKVTILDIGLNRNGLIEKRLEKTNEIDKTIGQCNGYSSSQLKKMPLMN